MAKMVKKRYAQVRLAYTVAPLWYILEQVGFDSATLKGLRPVPPMCEEYWSFPFLA